MNRREALAMLAALPGVACGKLATDKTVSIPMRCEAKAGRVAAVYRKLMLVQILDDEFAPTGERVTVRRPEVSIHEAIPEKAHVFIVRAAIGDGSWTDWIVCMMEVD